MLQIKKRFLNKLTPLSKEFYDEYEVNSSDINWKNKKFVFYYKKCCLVTS